MTKIIEVDEPEELYDALIGKQVRFINPNSATFNDTGVVTRIEECWYPRVRMDSHRPEYMDYEDTQEGSVVVDLDQIEFVEK